MYSEYSDEKLIALVAANNDKSAFETIYAKYSTPLYNYLDRLLFDKDSLDDLFQNVFLKIYVNAGKFKLKQGYSFKSWIYRIATNEYIDYFRSIKRKREKVHLDEYIEQKADDVNLEQIVYNKQKLECFYQAVDKLESPIKEAFVLKRMEGLKIDEIVSILKVSDRSVKNYCSKAENFIKSYLKKHSF